MSELNPFLEDIPIVAMVTAVRLTNGTLVESRHIEGNRVFGRIKKSTSVNADRVYMFGPLGNRIIPSRFGWDKIRPY